MAPNHPTLESLPRAAAPLGRDQFGARGSSGPRSGLDEVGG
jgi:hypothetical protein